MIIGDIVSCEYVVEILKYYFVFFCRFFVCICMCLWFLYFKKRIIIFNLNFFKINFIFRKNVFCKDLICMF